MKWNKIITDDPKNPNLPDFGKLVFVFMKKENKNYVALSSLIYIDSDGAHWNNLQDKFANIFDTFLKIDTSDFKPTHWAEIEYPEE